MCAHVCVCRGSGGEGCARTDVVSVCEIVKRKTEGEREKDVDVVLLIARDFQSDERFLERFARLLHCSRACVNVSR